MNPFLNLSIVMCVHVQYFSCINLNFIAFHVINFALPLFQCTLANTRDVLNKAVTELENSTLS